MNGYREIADYTRDLAKEIVTIGTNDGLDVKTITHDQCSIVPTDEIYVIVKPKKFKKYNFIRLFRYGRKVLKFGFKVMMRKNSLIKVRFNLQILKLK
jgi:hypothetical protein